jgi:hypothetical protein
MIDALMFAAADYNHSGKNRRHATEDPALSET